MTEDEWVQHALSTRPRMSESKRSKLALLFGEGEDLTNGRQIPD